MRKSGGATRGRTLRFDPRSGQSESDGVARTRRTKGAWDLGNQLRGCGSDALTATGALCGFTP
jgi:hypothetical protein